MLKMKTLFLSLAALFSIFLYARAFELNNQSKAGHHPKLVVTPANLNFFTCSSEGRPAPAALPRHRAREALGDAGADVLQGRVLQPHGEP